MRLLSSIRCLAITGCLSLALSACLPTQTPLSRERITNEPSTFESSIYAFRTGLNVISVSACDRDYGDRPGLFEICPFSASHGPDATWELLHGGEVVASGAAVNYGGGGSCWFKEIGVFQTEAFARYLFRLSLDSPVTDLGSSGLCISISGPGPK